MEAALILFVLGLVVIGYTIYQYLHNRRVDKIDWIVRWSYRELQHEKNSFQWLLDRTKTTDYLAWEELYERCIQKGIRNHMTLDVAGKASIRGILVSQLENIKT